MDTTELAVLFAGIALIGALLWFFFGPRKSVRAQEAAGVQEIEVRVEGGYSPDVITVTAGRPVRLVFYRDDTSSCSERVVLRDFGISKALPYRQRTPVEFTPTQPGEYPFVCGMNMLRGRIIVEPGRQPRITPAASPSNHS